MDRETLAQQQFGKDYSALNASERAIVDTMLEQSGGGEEEYPAVYDNPAGPSLTGVQPVGTSGLTTEGRQQQGQSGVSTSTAGRVLSESEAQQLIEEYGGVQDALGQIHFFDPAVNKTYILGPTTGGGYSYRTSTNGNTVNRATSSSSGGGGSYSSGGGGGATSSASGYTRQQIEAQGGKIKQQGFDLIVDWGGGVTQRFYDSNQDGVYTAAAPSTRSTNLPSTNVSTRYSGGLYESSGVGTRPTTYSPASAGMSFNGPNFGAPFEPSGGNFSLQKAYPRQMILDPDTGYMKPQSATYNSGLAIGNILQGSNPFIGPDSGVAVSRGGEASPLLNPESPDTYNPLAYMASEQATGQGSNNANVILAHGYQPTGNPIADAEAARLLHERDVAIMGIGGGPAPAMPNFATGGQMRVREPALLIGMMSRQPLAQLGEGGFEEIMSNGPGGQVQITPTRDQITMGREMGSRIGTLPMQANPMAQQRAFGQRGMAMAPPRPMPLPSPTQPTMPRAMPSYAGRIGTRPLASVPGFQYGGTLYGAWESPTDQRFYDTSLGQYGSNGGAYNPYANLGYGGYAPFTSADSSAQSLDRIANYLTSGGSGLTAPNVGSTYQTSGRTNTAGDAAWRDYYNLRLGNIGTDESELAQRRTSLEGLRPLETQLQDLTRSGLEADAATLGQLRPLEQNLEGLSAADLQARQMAAAGIRPLEVRIEELMRAGLSFDQAAIEAERSLQLDLEGLRQQDVAASQASLEGIRPLEQQLEQARQAGLAVEQNALATLQGLVPLQDSGLMYRYDRAQVEDPVSQAQRRIALERMGANIGIEQAGLGLSEAENSAAYEEALRGYGIDSASLSLQARQSLSDFERAIRQIGLSGARLDLGEAESQAQFEQLARNFGMEDASQVLRFAQSQADFDSAQRSFDQARASLNLSDAQSVARFQQAGFDLNQAERSLAEERAAVTANLAGLNEAPDTGGGTVSPPPEEPPPIVGQFPAPYQDALTQLLAGNETEGLASLEAALRAQLGDAGYTQLLAGLESGHTTLKGFVGSDLSSQELEELLAAIQAASG